MVPNNGELSNWCCVHWWFILVVTNVYLTSSHFFHKVFSSGTIKMRPQIKYPNYANTCPCAFCRLRANLTQNMKLRDTQLSRPCIIQNIRGHKSRLNAPHYRGFLSSLVISVKWFLAPHKSALTYSQDHFQLLCVVMDIPTNLMP